MHDISRWLFLAVLVWPVAVAVWLLSFRSKRGSRRLVVIFAALVCAWVAAVWGGAEPVGWSWSGGEVGGSAIEWRFAVTGIGLFWTVAVAFTASLLWSGGTNAPERSSAPGAVEWLILGSVIWLAAAGNPFTQLVCWELCALALWLYLRGSSQVEAVQHTGSRMLLTGLLMDGMLIGGTAAVEVVGWQLRGQPVAAQWNSVLLLQGVGWLLAGAGRAGLPPALSWSQGLMVVDRSQSVPFWWLGVVPAAGIAFARAGLALRSSSELLSSVWLLVWAMVALATTTAVARSGAARVASLPALTAGLMGLAALQFEGMAVGVLLYLLGFVAAVSLPGRVMGPQRLPSSGLLRLAGRDWGIPQAWRVFVELPLRGASQLLRFLDGLVFERMAERSLGRLVGRVAGVGRGDRGDPAWLPAVALLTTVVVLMLTRRW